MRPVTRLRPDAFPQKTSAPTTGARPATPPRANPPRTPFTPAAAQAKPHTAHALGRPGPQPPAPAQARRPGMPQPTRPQGPAAARPPATPQTGAAQRSPAPAPQQSGYRVHPPSPLGGGRQQIKVTIGGSRQIAGSVDMRPAKAGSVYISNLTVGREYRRQGLAGELMSAAMRSARGQGFTAARLEARPSDSDISQQALVSMYKRMGFRNVGRSDRGNPLMERRL